MTSALLVTAACKDKPRPVRQEPPWKYEIWTATPPPGETRVKFQGREVGKLDARHRILLEVADELLVSEHPGSVVFVVKTPCGDTDLTLTAGTPLEEKTARYEARKLSHPARQVRYLMDIGPGAPPLAKVWIDARGAPAGTKVAIGSLSLASDSTTPQTVYYPACPDGRKLSVGGQIVAELPEKHAHGSEYLIDLAANHCYRSRMHRYIESGLVPDPAEPDRKYEKSHAHVISAIDDFLKPAPDSLKALKLKGSTASATRRELLPVPCR